MLQILGLSQSSRDKMSVLLELKFSWRSWKSSKSYVTKCTYVTKSQCWYMQRRKVKQNLTRSKLIALLIMGNISWSVTNSTCTDTFDILNNVKRYNSVQFSSVTQSCLILCDPMNRSTPGLPVYHQLLEFTQTHVHRVRDAIQPSHPLSSPSPPAPNLPSIRVFSNESAVRMRWPKYWSFSFSIIPSLEPSKIGDLINKNQLYWYISWRKSYYWKFIYLEMLIKKENIHY